MMKQLLLLFLLLTGLRTAAQPLQELSLEQCFALAREHYPMIRQQELIAKSNEFTLDNIGRGYLPQLQIAGQATYQSDVTQLPVKLPGIDVPTLSKDQYKVYAELSQQLYDGGVISNQKKAAEANTLIAQQQLEVELYKIRDRVSQLYFGALVTNAQLEQNLLLQKDLELNISKAKAAQQNGTALQSNVDILQAELLNTQQRETELQAVKAATINMLQLFTGKEIAQQCRLQKPSARLLQPVSSIADIRRPELSLYDYQYKNLDAQDRLRSARNRPKLGLFLQGGYGRPALNFLQNDFTAYYIGGLRFSWSLSGLYTSNNERSLLALNKRTIDLQKETFFFNTRLAAEQQYSDIRKAEQLLQSDDEIIRLRDKVQQVASVQLEQGVITSGDYIRELNAADRARQNKILHDIQLLMAQQQLQWTTNQ